MKEYFNHRFLKDLNSSIEYELNKISHTEYFNLLNDNIIRLEFLNIHDGLEEYGILWSTEYEIFK